MVRQAAERARPGGRAREQDGGRRGGVDEALWQRAAAWKAADEARRRERGPGVPRYPQGRREPYRPWFAARAGEELWLNAERTEEPWFTQDDP